MARKRRKFAKHSSKRQVDSSVPPKPTEPLITRDIPSESYRRLSELIGNINRYLSWVALVLAFYFGINYERILNQSKAAFWSFFIVFLVTAAVKISLQVNTLRLFIGPTLDPQIHQKFRRRAVGLLTLSFFMIVVMAMPILYLHGYITQFSRWLQTWLPGKQIISGKVSLVIAFVAGAIVSGILGNLAYDVLKFVFRKLRKI